MLDAEYIGGQTASGCRGCARPQTYLLDSLEPDLEVGPRNAIFPPPYSPPTPVAPGVSMPVLIVGAVILGGVLWALGGRKY